MGLLEEVSGTEGMKIVEDSEALLYDWLAAMHSILHHTESQCKDAIGQKLADGGEVSG